jgi:hypothetical protein
MQRGAKWDSMCYPGRDSLYSLTLYPLRAKRSNGPLKDWVYLAWLRQASYVNTSFRHELGKVLWSHVHIDAENENQEVDKEEKWFPNNVLSEIESFLSERPAARKGIRGLSIDLEIAKGQRINYLGNFDCWCEKISKNLDMEVAFFNIKVSERDLKHVIEGKESCLDGLAATSKLRVSGCFDVDLERVYVEDVWWGWSEDGDNDDDDDEPLDSKYKGALLEFMMPLTLRDREAETEEEKYLQVRAEEVQEIEELEEAEEADVIKEVGQTEGSTED